MLLTERRFEAQRYYSENLKKLAGLNCTCFAKDPPSFNGVYFAYTFGEDHDVLDIFVQRIERYRHLYRLSGCSCGVLKLLDRMRVRLRDMCQGLCLACVRENKDTPTSSSCNEHSKQRVRGVVPWQVDPDYSSDESDEDDEDGSDGSSQF